ncbi:hypothetical protein [Bacillus salipaludis]|uniref:hypothetical protein n=1 Tax=Bacillus salipaludis TaxID=2547811 RepID=UPI002E1F1A63|nr:hypothetical protein [Bacillus salipaludis]
MFNEYEVYQMLKLRQEEVERKAQDAWKLEDWQKDTFCQRIVKKFNSRNKSTIVKTTYECCSC